MLGFLLGIGQLYFLIIINIEGGFYMATTFKTASGEALKVRRLKWKEYRKYQKMQKERLEAGDDTMDIVEEVVKNVIIEPKGNDKILDELEVDEVMKIFSYAMGGPEEDLKN